jgi:calcium-dependent protein kinase
VSRQSTQQDALRAHALTNLGFYQTRVKLKQAVTTFIVLNIINSQETQELERLFREGDTDKDGAISKEELLKLYRNRMSETEATQEIEAIFENVDTDKSGKIEISEFVAVTMDHETLYSKANLRRTFDAIDIDKSGTITSNEIELLIGDRSIYQHSVWIDILKEAAIGRNELTFEDFKNLMLSRLH